MLINFQLISLDDAVSLLLQDIFRIINDEFKIKTNKIIEYTRYKFRRYVLNITGKK